MRSHIYLGLLLLTAFPLWSQVEPSGSGGDTASDEYQMSMPPQASGGSYSTSPTVRSNYFSAGLLFTTAYDDNYFVGQGSAPVGVTSFLLFPTLGFYQSTARQSCSISYGAGFTFLQPVSQYNAVNQGAAADFSYRTSRHSTLSIQEHFQQNSSLLNQPYTFGGNPVSGSTIGQPPLLIVPYADQRLNSTGAQFSYQFSRDAMLGGGGSYAFFHYPNLEQTPGLNNSNYEGANAFYTRRVSKGQYLGLMYQFGRTTTNPIESTTHTQVGTVIYSMNISPRFLLSLTAGPEYFDSQEVGYPESSSLGSMVNGSFHWHEKRTDVAVSYSQSVTAGQGLVGAYHTNSFNASARWQITRTWEAGLNAMYSNFTNAAPTVVSANPGGHTLFGRAMIEHSLGERLNLEADYRRLHQTYGGIAAINPDDDRVSVSINYQFRKPLGR